jgi:chromosome segregation ATPase
MNFFVFSQNNRGRRGSDEILRQSLARCEAERELTGRAYITLKSENQDLLRENRELKDKVRVLEGKQRDLEAKNRELDGKYQLCLSKVEGMAGAERDRISKMAGLYREINDLRGRISRN